MLGFRFSYMYKLHAESFMGFNAVCLPGNPPGAFYRSSLPATPVSTPIRENGRFSAQALRERLCRTPSPRKYRLFEPRASEPDIGFNLDVGLQLSSPDDEIDEEAPFPNPTQQWDKFELQESKISSHRLKRRVFVANLGYHIKKDQLQHFFSKFGRVLDCVIAHDHIMRQARGYGFVIFSNQEDAKKAQDASTKELEFAGRVLRVFPCQEKKCGRYRREARDALFNWNTDNGLHENIDNSDPRLGAYKRRQYRPNRLRNFSELNDDVLLLIFSYLDLRDKVKLELVCKKWKCLAIHLWRTTKSLEMNDSFTNDQPLSNDILCCLLKKCGRCLEKLDLSVGSHTLNFKCGELIALLCPNLETIDLTGIPLNNEALRLIASNCKKLKHVSLRHTRDISEKGVWWLLHLCRNIEHLDLGENFNVTGQCLHMANPMIQKLNIEQCIKFGQPGFLKIATKCQQLVYLNLSNCGSLSDRALELLCQSLYQLKELHLSGRYYSLTNAGLDKVGRLHKLETLSLCGNPILNNDSLQAIVIGCRNLVSLNVSSTNITDAAFSELSGCYSLKKLKMNYLEQITDEGICHLSRHSGLEFVEMRGCFQVGDQGLVSILTVSSRLQHLDLSGCDRVTNVTVRSCYDAVHARQNTNNKPLFLITGGTSAVYEALDFRPHPLLTISNMNYCIRTQEESDIYHSGDYVREDDLEEEEGAIGGEIFQPREEEDTKSLSNFSWAEVAEYPL